MISGIDLDERSNRENGVYMVFLVSWEKQQHYNQQSLLNYSLLGRGDKMKGGDK